MVTAWILIPSLSLLDAIHSRLVGQTQTWANQPDTTNATKCRGKDRSTSWNDAGLFARPLQNFKSANT